MVATELFERVRQWQWPQLHLHSRNWRLLFLLAGYLAFIVVGAAIFSAIESPLEAQLIRQLGRVKQKFARDHQCVSESDLERLIVVVVDASNRGVSAAKNISTEPNWSFGQSFFFAATVVTTIGYGHVTPLSEGGKAFCVVFAIVGIPMTLIMLSAFVDKLMIPSSYALQWLNSRLGHLHQPFQIRLLHLAGSGLLVLLVALLLPALVFYSIEPDWSYLDSLYYCFISITTVGLGDYIPGDHPQQSGRPLYKVLATFYLLLGLVLMMWLLSVFADVPQLNFGIVFMRRSDQSAGDPERTRLASSPAPGPRYTTQTESHVKVVSRPAAESPSPEETTPVHARH